MSQKRAKEGALVLSKKGKQFNFKYGPAYFQYFKGTETSKAEGQILTGQITKVEAGVSKHIGEFPFEVHFTTAKGSPWLLLASSEEERISWMEVIKPGSAAHLKAAVAPQLPQVDLSASWPRAGPGLPIRRDQQLPYMLHPGQQQPPQRPPEVATPPQPPQRPPEVATPPQPPQRPPEVATPQRQPSQHSLNLRSASVESGGSGGGGVTAEPYMQPGVLVMSVPAMPTVVPPLTPSRSSSGHMQRAHTFPDVDTVPDADTFPDVNTFPDSDTDKNGYMKIAPTSVPPPPMARRMTQPVFSNPEESVLPVPPTTSAQVGTVVDMMKNMSVEQVQMLVQMLSKLAPGGSQNGGNAPVHPPQLLTMISQSPDVGDHLLVTEDDESYEPRPDWAKANATISDDDLGQSSDLQKEALFISSSSLSDHVPIGKGQFGEVFKAVLHKGTPGEVLVAVKTTKTNSTEKDKADFMKEMVVMSTLLHPNIVRLYGLVNENQDSSSIVLEYLPNGDLKHFLVKNPRPVKQLVKYMIDVAMGMHYLSERGLVHRDLAARNVLVGENEVCKVADFGLLRELPKEDSIYQSTANAPLPVRWMAPESIQRRNFSVASDVWSYGILMWEMFNPDKIPYPNMNNMECISKVSEGYRLPPARGTTSIIVRLMRACWHKQPEKRPSFLIISTLLTTKAFAEIEMGNSKS